MGRLIPAGTGYPSYKNIGIKTEADELYETEDAEAVESSEEV